MVWRVDSFSLIKNGDSRIEMICQVCTCILSGYLYYSFFEILLMRPTGVN